METMVTTPYAKKKRLEEHEMSQKESHGEELQPPTREWEGEEGIDRISGLLDGVLGDIISLLPTKNGARTQILASRWRDLWPYAPLNLNHNSLPVNEEVQAGLISHIIANHNGPARRISLPVLHLHHRRATLNTWLQSPTLKNLQDLEFEATGLVHIPRLRPLLSEYVFKFSHTLRSATISECQVRDMIEVRHFPNLKQLGLESVMISDYAFHNLMVGCPILESLLLKRCYGFYSIRINSTSLKSIGLSTNTTKVTIVIEDAPLLERFLKLELFIGKCIHVTVISAPKVETLGSISDCDSDDQLVFDTTVIQKLDVVSFTRVVCSVKVLAISIHNLGPGIVINLMRCFPCMEKLYIQISNVQRSNNICPHMHRDLIRCLDTSLTTVVLKNYRGLACKGNKKLIAKQRRLLHIKERASRGALFCFTSCRCHSYPPHIKHVDDLSKGDPFKCTC
ncbi:hypothetical protein SETIT_4G112800v2 [Setaria italica]|uniref:F-box/LRR-repeat protein 15/At3g58940/PEG3-like LRR domain-containing protein n=1 Tax=Setaria italica TaxID=4555 RepID=A0A368QTM9_SETIT|nr:hypothetical protein SETIT_4G112800v2 [Setaria italica]